MSRREERKELELLEDIDESLKTLIILNQGIAASLAALVAQLVPFATTAVLSQGGTMSIPSGGTTPVAVTFVDSSTPPVPQAPPTGDGSGLVVTLSADNPVVTISALTLSGDAYTGTATAGDVSVDTPFNYTAVVANTSGAPLLDDDGTTPFVQPAALASSVTAAVVPPSQATTAVISEG